MSGIVVLPESTVRTLGSAQSLTDSCSLVKELIENSIDAQATSISVEVSPNLLDRIRIRDNGQSINPEDRRLVCQRHSTSKIRSLDDLALLGGRSMGFRGEALASAVELSSKFTLFSRVEGEDTASMIEFDRGGSVTNEKRVSNPTGTTVQIDGFLFSLPVRKHAIERSASRLISKIKRQLHAYIFAKPRIRFSLKILKTKDGIGNWDYKPSIAVPPHGFSRKTLLFDAIVKLQGKKVADQCLWISSALYDDDQLMENGESVDPPCFLIEGFLIKPSCDDAPAVANAGHFVSIDSRPVSCSRGVLKEFVGQYRACIRRCFGPDFLRRGLEPLLILNVLCPLGSYDVNIEPAKDDVLFHQAPDLMEKARILFSKVYEGEVERTGESQTLRTTRDKSTVNVRMTDELQTEQNREQQLQSPAALAKTASLASHEKSRNDNSKLSYEWNKTSTDLVNQEHLDQQFRNGSPRRVSIIHKSGHFSQNADSEDEVPGIEDDEKESGENLRDIQKSNPWVSAKLNSKSLPSRSSPSRVHLQDGEYQFPTPARQQGDVVDRIERSSSPSENLGDIFPYPLSARRAIVREESENPRTNCLDKRTRDISEYCKQSSTYSISSPDCPSGEAHPDLAATLDYEARKQRAAQKYRENLRRERAQEKARHQQQKGGQQMLDSMLQKRLSFVPSPSPHQNRYNKARAALHASPENQSEEQMTPSLFISSHTPSRRKSLCSSLERVEKRDHVLDCVLPLSTSIQSVTKFQEKAVEKDEYFRKGTMAHEGLDVDDDTIRTWESRIRSLLSRQSPMASLSSIAELDIRIPELP